MNKLCHALLEAMKAKNELNAFIVETHRHIKQAKLDGNPISGIEVLIKDTDDIEEVSREVSFHFPDLDVDYVDYEGNTITPIDPIVASYMEALKHYVGTHSVGDISLVGSSYKSKDFMADLVVQLYRTYPGARISIDGFNIDLS